MIGNAPKASAFAGLAGQIVTGTVQENLFIGGFSFSYTDRLLYAAAGAKIITFDGRLCTCGQIVFNPILFSSNSGPILIDFYAGVTLNATPGGATLEPSNRRATSDNVSDAVLLLDPTIDDMGTRFAGDLVPANESAGVGTSNQGAASSAGLPFEIDHSLVYAIDIENLDGADTYVKVDMTWFEIPS
jgi:hypothetical protein